MPTKILDLSYPIYSGMPVYPGTPAVGMKRVANISITGYAENQLTLTSHTGTHFDAPAHLLQEGKTLDTYPPEWFYGSACCLDIHADARLLLTQLEAADNLDFVLFYTGMEQYWGMEDYFQNYPVLPDSCVELLCQLTPKAVGLDASSFDLANNHEYTIHKRLLDKDILLLENLRNLKPLIGKPFTLSCAPLSVQDTDGAPVRALAIIHE